MVEGQVLNSVARANFQKEKETSKHKTGKKDTCTPMFIEALFTIAKT